MHTYTLNQQFCKIPECSHDFANIGHIRLALDSKFKILYR